MKPNYHKIFSDIIAEENLSLEKITSCKKILSQSDISDLEILNLNYLIFGNTDDNKHKAYDEETINYVTSYQIEYQLTNQQISKLFDISRNTISKWRNMNIKKSKN